MMSQQGQFAAMTLSDLLVGKWLPDAVGSIAVTGMCLDHRKLIKGDVFFALAGTRVDGRTFIQAAMEAGAAAVLKQAESEEETIEWRNGIPVVPVLKLPQQVSAIAATFYAKPSTRATVIGITGTNGKSTCSHLLAQLLNRLGKTSAVLGTLGYGIVNKNHQIDNLTETGLTTPDAIATQKMLAELVDNNAACVAMEVSSHSLVQYRVSGTEFELAVFTNITRDHLDYHGDMKSYAAAKQSLFAFNSLQHRVINWDDPLGQLMSAKSHPQAPAWTYSLADPAAHIYAKKITQHRDGMTAELESCWGKGVLNTSLLGQFNLSNLLAVVVSACVLGYELETVLAHCDKLQAVPGRMEKVGDAEEINVVVDYAHTPDGLSSALQAMREHTQGRLICLFGCGGDRDKGKRPMMAAIAEQLADAVVVTSDNPRGELPSKIIADIHSGFSDIGKVTEIEDRAQAIRHCIVNAQRGDSILIAGKGHEQYQQIGENRLAFSDVKQARLALRERKH